MPFDVGSALLAVAAAAAAADLGLQASTSIEQRTPTSS